MSLPKNLIIITGTPSTLKNISSVFRQTPSARWLYCGKDVPFSLELDAALGESTRINIGRTLQDTAREFRQEYIDFVGQISDSNANNPSIDRWWLSSLSEKNPFISNVFLYFCYVKICQRLLEMVSENIIIICESHELSQSLFTNLQSSKKYRVSLPYADPNNLPEKVKLKLRPALKKAWFFGAFSFRIVISRVFRLLTGIWNGRPSEPSEICIHAFTDARSLVSPDHYQHIYFRDLGPGLEGSGTPYFYLIDALPTISYISIVNRLFHYPEKCYLLEEYVIFSDLIRAYYFVRESGTWWSTGSTLGDIQMDQILEGESNRDRINTRREEAYLRYCAVKRFSSQSKIKTFTYTFENHIWEKMFCRAFRNFSPGTILVGYAHSIVNFMYTCYTASGYEQNLLPLPDVIAVNGIRGKNVLEQSGFMGKKIVVVGALRYQHLKKIKFSEKRHEEKTVLVALSAGIDDSLELTYNILCALGNREGIIIDIKCHPILPFKIISPYIRSLPENVRIREEPIENLLTNSDVLLYSESTVCLEALAMGVPIVNIRSNHRINVNILEGIEVVPSVSAPEEIQEAIKFVTSGEALEQFDNLQVIVDEFFAPLTKDYLEVFIGMNEPA
jgi:glycosyltransferase involved in cell wall biosynthesis